MALYLAVGMTACTRLSTLREAVNTYVQL